jgi:hypothetical protein
MTSLGFSRGDGAPILVILALFTTLLVIWLAPSGPLTVSEKSTTSAVVVSAIGLIFTFWQAERSRRKQFKINFLIDAYRALEETTARAYDRCEWYREFENTWALKLENAVRDIQLMGSPRLAGLAHAATHNMNDPVDRQRNFQKLLIELRNELRRELGEPRIPDDPRSLRHVYRGPPTKWCEPCRGQSNRGSG